MDKIHPKQAALPELRNETASDSAMALPTSELHREYLQAATSDNTRRTYRSAIRHFQRWGGGLPCKEETIINYLLHHASLLNSRTLEVRLTALSQWHRYQGLYDPAKSAVVRKTMEGIKRKHGKPKNKAIALRLEHVALMVNHLLQSPMRKKCTRDLALILVGYFGGLRRSEIVAIEVEHIDWEPEGVVIKIPRSKTDQEGTGMLRAIPNGSGSICPIKALKNWLDVSNITNGAVFRPVNRWDKIQDRAMNENSINALLKSIGQSCSFDFTPDLSSHSLRRGFSTSAAREQVPFESIKKQGGWKSDATVWEYIDEGERFQNNAAAPLIQKLDELIT